QQWGLVINMPYGDIRTVVLLSLIYDLGRKSSWCGETHVQKAGYFLQELCDVPMGFTFVLYKHGPFSFDLGDHINALRADGYLDLIPRFPVGPTVMVSVRGKDYIKAWSETIEQFRPRIEFVSTQLAGKEVVELERLATALYVSKIVGFDKEAFVRASEISRRRPHVTNEEAIRAVEELDNMVQALAAELAGRQSCAVEGESNIILPGRRRKPGPGGRR
ncbi:MAG: hypothetical protein ACPLRM_08480, partial [Anaerolineae bacterium]